MSQVIVYTTHYSLDDKPLPGYLEWTERINNQYCQRYNYQWHVCGVGRHTRPHPWSRVYHAIKLARSTTEPGYLMFIDGDAYVRDFEKSVEQVAEKYLTGSKVFVAAPDVRDAGLAYHPDLPNAGVFIAKLPEAISFLEAWWQSPTLSTEPIYDSNRYLDASDSLHHHPYEQLALWHLWQSQSDKLCLTEDHRELNGRDGQFVCHMVATRDNNRISNAKAFWETIQNGNRRLQDS